MEIRVICVGKINDSNILLAIKKFINKIEFYNKISIVEVAEKTFKVENSDTIAKSLKSEGGIIKKYFDNSYNIALCIEGKQLDSLELADKMNKIFTNHSHFKYLNFIIGSSHGIDSKIKNECDFKLSISKLTFPHQIVRLIIIEQIYRAFAIINNEKYHK